jgi:hypothetical protein
MYGVRPLAQPPKKNKIRWIRKESSMQTKQFRLVLLICIAMIPAIAQIPTPELNKQLTNAARQLSAISFDSGSPVTVRGQIATLVWPEGGSGMILVYVNGGGEKYAFSTAKVAQLAKQGFSRFTVHPGEEVIVTGVLASGGQKIGPGFTGARADVITKSDGTRVFDRSRLAGSDAK